MKKRISTQRQEKLHQILHRMREEVIVDIEHQIGRKLDPDMTHKIDVAMDTGDWAAFDLSEGVDYKLLEMRYQTYKEIADALRRLEAETYGVCERCGAEILMDRLKVAPFARYCVPCLSEIEALEAAEKETGRSPSF